MRPVFLIILFSTVTIQGCAQNQSQPVGSNKPSQSDIKVGGGCEGCEAIYESPVPFEQLNAVDTLPDFKEAGPRIRISGIVYQRDGKTPAKNVILYIYHTDQQGHYSTRGNQKGWGLRHGYIRGWIRTGDDGSYQFYTLVPASYPNSKNPQHIHPVIKEPGKTEYWIDEYVFDSDPLLPKEERNRPHPVGSNGVLHTTMKDGVLQARRDIILGLNVRGYPK